MLSDADICENAAYALHFEVASQLIRGAVKNGWLTLTGEEVANEAEKEAAQKTVLYVRGVRGIRNYITVVSPAKPEETVKFIEAVPPPNEPKDTGNH
jgi:osmotically-inducible protein OsmY